MHCVHILITDNADGNINLPFFLMQPVPIGFSCRVLHYGWLALVQQALDFVADREISCNQTLTSLCQLNLTITIQLCGCDAWNVKSMKRDFYIWGDVSAIKHVVLSLVKRKITETQEQKEYSVLYDYVIDSTVKGMKIKKEIKQNDHIVQ